MKLGLGFFFFNPVWLSWLFNYSLCSIQMQCSCGYNWIKSTTMLAFSFCLHFCSCPLYSPFYWVNCDYFSTKLYLLSYFDISFLFFRDCSFTFHFHALEKEMATHSGVLAWRIPGMAEPGGLLSMGSHRVGHDWSDLAAAAALEIKICVINLYSYL